MSVQSARVQSLVKGDDAVLTHQIMGDVAFNAEASRAPVTAASGDVVNFFYPLEDSTMVDLIGYTGIPVGSYPTSEFTVAIPGLIIDPASVAPNRGASTFQSGLGRTVRAEIQRLKATQSGNTTLNSYVITGLGSTTGISTGDIIVGANIPAQTYVTAVGTTTVSISKLPTTTASAVSLTFYQKESHYLISEVDVFERGFPNSLIDTSGGVNPPQPPLNLT